MPATWRKKKKIPPTMKKNEDISSNTHTRILESSRRCHDTETSKTTHRNSHLVSQIQCHQSCLNSLKATTQGLK